MIFDDLARTDLTSKRHSESSFAYLNRSARVEISRVREFLEKCVADYPRSEAGELVARLRSGDDRQFDSASFELLLHALLRALNYELEPHPLLTNGSASRPDFLVSTPQGNRFFLEAVLASEISDATVGTAAIKGSVMDALNAVTHANFVIDVLDEGHPKTQPSGKKLARSVLAWLDSLDPDAVQDQINANGYDAIAPFVWTHDGWTLSIKPIPIKPERRGRAKSLVGVSMGGAGWINAWTPIRDAIKSKGSKYGVLELPLVVAVNVDAFTLDRRDEVQALFGQEEIVVSVDQPEREPRTQRALNGAWIGLGGPQYTRVSGAWLFNNLSPYTVASRRNTLYLNPWAAATVPDELLTLPHAKGNAGVVEWVGGASLRDIFGLRDQWPETD